MGGNMGTPPAPSQPPQVNFETTAESRGNFNNFLRSIPQTTNMTPPPPMGSSPMPSMGGNPMANIDIFNQPMGMMGMNQPPMNPMMQPPMQTPMMMAGGGNVPPRNVDIMGEDHMLAYITPEEGGILKALGGSGAPGPMGIPSFFDAGEGSGGYGSDDSATSDDGSDNNENQDDGSSYSDDAQATDPGSNYSDNDGSDNDDDDDAQDYSDGSGTQDTGNVGDSTSGDYTDYDDSDPDQDMDYTDPDYGYTDQDTDTGQDDMDRAYEEGRKAAEKAAREAADRAEKAAKAARDKAAADAKAELDRARAQAARDKSLREAVFQSRLQQDKLDRANLMSDISTPIMGDMNMPNITAGSMPGGPPTSNVAAAAGTSLGTSQTNVPNDLDSGFLDSGLSLPTNFEEKVGKDFNAQRMADIERLYNVDVGQTKGGKGTDPTFFESKGVPGTLASIADAIEKGSRERMATEVALGRPMGLDETLFGYTAPTLGPKIELNDPNAQKKMDDFIRSGSGETIQQYNERTGRSIPENQVVRSDSGRILAIKDASGRVVSGTDPNAEIPSGDDNESPLILRKRPKNQEKKDPVDLPPNVIGGGDPVDIPKNPFIVDSPFTTDVGDFRPVGFSAGDINKLIESLTGIAAPQSMARGGVAGYAGGGLISAVDNFLASV